jgi:PAS domain S-box-containing protein
MPEFLARLLDTSDFPPRWACGEWDAGHGWLHVLSDLGVWSAYLVIPGVLAVLAARRPDLPFRRLVWPFGALLLLGAATHLMDAVLFWWPAYRLAGALKLAAAVVSWGAVLALVRVAPRVLAARSPADLEREIAARIRAEAVLRASEELNRTVIASAVDAIVTSNAEGVVIAWNRGAERMFGRPADDVVGRLFADVVTDDFDLSPVAFSMPAELYSRRADGTPFPIELTLTVWQLDSGSFYTVIVRDVSDRKQAEDQLRRTEARLRLAQDVAGMGTWEIDLAAERCALDPRYREQLGFAPGEFDGTLAAVLARVHPDDRAAVVRALDPVLVAQEMFECEYRVAPRSPGEAVRWLSARGQVVTPAGEAAPRLVGVTFDVTDRKQAESDLRQARRAVPGGVRLGPDRDGPGRHRREVPEGQHGLRPDARVHRGRIPGGRLPGPDPPGRPRRRPGQLPPGAGRRDRRLPHGEAVRPQGAGRSSGRT